MGETRFVETCGHITCANDLPFFVHLMTCVGLKSHKVSHTSNFDQLSNRSKY